MLIEILIVAHVLEFAALAYLMGQSLHPKPVIIQHREPLVKAPASKAHSTCSQCGHTVARFTVREDGSAVCANCDSESFVRR